MTPPAAASAPAPSTSPAIPVAASSASLPMPPTAVLWHSSSPFLGDSFADLASTSGTARVAALAGAAVSVAEATTAITTLLRNMAHLGERRRFRYEEGQWRAR